MVVAETPTVLFGDSQLTERNEWNGYQDEWSIRTLDLALCDRAQLAGLAFPFGSSTNLVLAVCSLAQEFLGFF
jgi:hypothetical protein